MILPLCGNASTVKNLPQDYTKTAHRLMEAGIAKMLVEEGIVDQNATPQVIEEAAVVKELQENGIDESQYNNLLHGRKLGSTLTDIEGVQESPYGGTPKTEKLLIPLADFGVDLDSSNGSGPLNNSIQKPQPEDNSSFWVSKFDVNHYKGMLFTEGGYDAIDQNGNTLHLDSMVDFYREQSGGKFKVEGDVYGWFTLPH